MFLFNTSVSCLSIRRNAVHSDFILLLETLLNRFPAFYGKRSFITVFISLRYCVTLYNMLYVNPKVVTTSSRLSATTTLVIRPANRIFLPHPEVLIKLPLNVRNSHSPNRINLNTNRTCKILYSSEYDGSILHHVITLLSVFFLLGVSKEQIMGPSMSVCLSSHCYNNHL